MSSNNDQREIERKFELLSLPKGISEENSDLLEQAYVETDPVIRIRKIVHASKTEYILTVKSGGLMAHSEFELSISREAYERLCRKAEGRVITKRRYRLVLDEAHILEIDRFYGAFEGLVFAEIEFASEEEAAHFPLPDYFGKELTEDPAFHNNRMSAMTEAEANALAASLTHTADELLLP